jgi:hypothetical protein
MSSYVAGKGPIFGAIGESLQDGVRYAIVGKILTRPQLVRADGGRAYYAADVQIAGTTEPCRLVPIAASAGGQVQYAEVGYAVTLRRVPETGGLEISGFSAIRPGSYKRVSVDLSTGAVGALTDVGLTSRPLTLGELADYGGGFGTCPLGAVAIFQGGTFLRLG